MITVLAHGCFRLLHPGHIFHLREARRYGDRLVVSLTAGRFIRKDGGALFSDEERIAMLRELRCIDDVFLCEEETGVTALQAIKPQVFVKGVDYVDRGLCEAEKSACFDLGVQVRFTQTKKYSTSELIGK